MVSLDLCTDWLLARYAPREQVAALSPLNRRYPVAWLDESWPVHDGSLERILQLQPDLVISGEYNARLLRGRLQALGVRVEVLPLPARLADIAPYVRRVLDLLGLPDEPLGDEGEAPAAPAAGRRLLLLGANGVGTGLGTLENEVIERAGWRNYLRDEGHVALDLEPIAADPPDAVLWASPESPALANRYAEHPVLKRAVPPEHWLTTDYWRWECPGPWTWDLIRELRREAGRWAH